MFGFDPFSASAFGDYLELTVPDGSDDDASTGGLYAEMLAMAAEVLAEFNTGTVVLYNEATTTVTSDDPFAPDAIGRTPLPVSAVVTGYSSARIDGASILAGDVRVIIDPTDIVTPPFKGQRLTVDARLFSIVEVKSVMAGGAACVYIVQARSAN